MRALITGVSGFVGQHLTQHLLAKDYEIIGTYYGGAFESDVIHHVECDIRDANRIAEIICQHPVDEIYHLAGPAFIPQTVTNPRLAYEVIFEGTLNLYEAVRQSGRNPKMLYVGSGDEYGAFGENELPLKETTTLCPITPYGVAKAAADLLSFQYSKLYNLHVVRVRPFNHTGPGQADSFVCSSFAKQFALIEKGNKEPVLSVGNLDSARDFCDVRDVVDAYWLLMQNGTAGSVYNVCAGKPTSIRWILDTLIEQSGLDNIEIKVDPQKVRISEFPEVYGDNGLIKKELGWFPKHPLAGALNDLLNYWRSKI